MKQLNYLLVLVLVSAFCSVANAKVINCYYGSWATYRTGNGKFTSSDVDPNLCTHLMYSFFGIDDNTGAFKVLDSWLDFNLGSISQAIALKNINPNLKVLAVVGGWNEGSIKYSQMAADANKRQTFIQTTLQFIQDNGFDGLDLDWEYPAQRGGTPQDKQNFVTLLQEIKQAFTPFNYELSIAVGASANTAMISYDIPGISQHLDYINVMTYDFAMASDGRLGFNAALKGQGQNNVEDSINYWLNNGAPASKLVLGLAFYGRTFQLANNLQTTPGSLSAGPGQAGPYTGEPGYLGYNEICPLVPSWNYVFDGVTDCPYIFKDNQWVGYDNVQSIDLKMDFLNSKNLGGAMVWSIETDDFHGVCGEKFPLLNAINRKLGNNPGSPPINTTTTTNAPPTTNPTDSPSGSGCSKDGFFSNESDCSKYYQCVNGVRYDFSCPAGLKFDTVSSTCTWPDQANC